MSIAAAACTQLAGPAQAAGGGKASLVGSTLRYVAAPGDANHITVTGVGEFYYVQDVVPIAAGDGCVHVTLDEKVVACKPLTPTTWIVIDGGDGPDYIDNAAEASPAILTGGAGNDRLFGGPASDQLDGGVGDDELRGAPGDDRLIGGPGRDTLVGNPGNDYLDGGPGPDHLRGDDGNDQLFGGRGEDLLEGSAGDDRLDGNEDVDRLDGGPHVLWDHCVDRPEDELYSCNP